MDDHTLADQLVDRPPRIQPPLPTEEIEIPSPPDTKTRGRSMVQLLIPMMMILAYLLISITGKGRNPIFMIPMGISIVASSLLAFYSNRKEAQQLEQLKKDYAKRLLTMRNEMNSSHDAQRLFYLHNYPEIRTTLTIFSEEKHSRIGPRLWERRPDDSDFGSVCIGIGDIPSTVIYAPPSSGGGTQEDPQMAEAIQLAEDSLIVSDVPIPLPLRPSLPLMTTEAEGNYLPGRYSIGISGPTTSVSSYLRAMLVHLTAFHSPHDVQLHVIGAPHAKMRWEWANWLPHTNTRRRDYSGDRMCFEAQLFDAEDPKKPETWLEGRRSYPEAFWEVLKQELEDRQLRMEDEKDRAAVALPFVVVVVDNLPPLESAYGQDDAIPWLDDATDEAAVAAILQNGAQLGMAIIFLVPTPSKIPSDCQSVIEIQSEGDKVAFRYSEIGVNSERYVGNAHSVAPDFAEDFAKAIRDLTVRMGYGADLPDGLPLLELYHADMIDDLKIAQHWITSRRAEEADWMRVALGMMSGHSDLELYFHQDYDGVHGMIAGTTGSGKSELLMTLICGLAIRYDPSIINFVLVDYKGGAAFEPFRSLPHCVDIVTNLDGHAVERMFVAVKAELARRSKILADYKVKHVVEYRKWGYHLTDPLPHLFIIVDEFAEMVSENSEYKAQFDSITRLGRAIGVSLILATQRPTGAVTDQMRANMKFRMCLRVETSDDSRELLGRSDATFLPSNIPGRAYLQIGNESLKLAQIAWAGGRYTGKKEQEEKGDILFADAPQEDVVSADDDTSLEPETVLDRIVMEMVKLAEQNDDVLPQHKPWPDPLPPVLSLNEYIDTQYLTTTRSKQTGQIYLGREITTWIRRGSPPSSWLEGRAVSWQHNDKPLTVDIGLIDMPSNAEQRLFTIDMTVGPLVLFGSGGWGKTTFLATLMTSLAASHSPRELIMYALDFGRGGLSPLVNMPHLARPVDVTEDSRVNRLLRILENILDERMDIVRQYGTLPDYNMANADRILPAVLVAIDNFAEFRDNFESLIPRLISLIRAGRAMGIYFAITADQSSALPSKLYSLFTQRLTLKLADDGEYQNVVGRGLSTFTETPGRGMIEVERSVREFHIAVPTIYDAAGNRKDLAEVYRALANKMHELWDRALGGPQEVEPLQEQILLSSLLPKAPSASTKEVTCTVGVQDIDRKPLAVDLANRGPHCLVIGPPLSGKTTTLRTWILSMAYTHSPNDVAFILIDPKQALFKYRGDYHLGNLPHVLETVGDSKTLLETINRLNAEYDPAIASQLHAYAASILGEDGEKTVFSSPTRLPRQVVVVIDNYEDFGDFELPKTVESFSELARKYRDQGLHFIICGADSILRSRDNLMRRVESSRYALVLQSPDLVSQMGGRPGRMGQEELPVGRCFLMRAGQIGFGQVAITHNERLQENMRDVLDQWVRQIILHFKGKEVSWYYTGTMDMYQNATDETTQQNQKGEDDTSRMVDVEFSEDITKEREAILERIRKSQQSKQ